MATTGAERRALGLAAMAVVAAALVGSCAAPGPGPAMPVAPETAAPTIQIGLMVGAAAVTLGGDGALAVLEPDGRPVLEIPAGERWRASAGSSGIALATESGVAVGRLEQFAIAPRDSGGFARVNGQPYRGTLLLFRDRTGLTVVNQLDLEAYLLGVVSGEMGRRAPSEREALLAQAVVSRTYAMRNLGRWRAQGFDLYATVADQVYGGVSSETEQSHDAVAATRGQIVTYGGQPIDAFFFSTCAGRTAAGTEVFRAAERPYLQSVSDMGGDGRPYCGGSPRLRWREEWTGETLRTVLRQSLPAVAGIARGRVADVRDVRIAAHTASGRVARLALALAREEVTVDGPQIRQVLRPRAGEMLRSTAFTLTGTRRGGRLVRLVAEGQGNGHGVGFCQWGAVGRARAGHDYRSILAAYYPGTEVQRAY